MPEIKMVARGWVKVGDDLFNFGNISRIRVLPPYKRVKTYDVVAHGDGLHIMASFPTEAEARALLEEIVRLLK